MLHFVKWEQRVPRDPRPEPDRQEPPQTVGERKKEKTEQLAALQSLLLHLTGAGLPPATSPLRGGGEEGGRKGGDFASHQIRFKKQNTKKHLWTRFSFFTVLK